jgi:hypothetical protein
VEAATLCEAELVLTPLLALILLLTLTVPARGSRRQRKCEPI